MSSFDLRERVALVTGSTKGIGPAIAERFADHGACVTISSRNQADCDQVAAAINGRSGAGRAIGIAADQSDANSLRRLVQQSLAHWGRIDVLVGNAVLSSIGRIEKVEPEDFTRALEANVSHNALLAKLVAGPMKEQGGGCIIFIVSTAAIAAMPDYPVYGASKAAMKHLTAILAIDFSRCDIRVNAIAPGLIRTESTRVLWSDPAALKVAVGKTPVRRIGEADEIAGCAVFLASAAGAFTTGQTFVVDGGQSIQGVEGVQEVIQVFRQRQSATLSSSKE